MFNKPRPTQLELFTPSDSEILLKKNTHNIFFEKLAVYEKNIILVVCFMVIFIIAYALGIEKGKHVNLTENRNILPQVPVSSVTIAPQPAVKTTPARQDAYTVQVASFKNRSLAEKEKLSLEKRGIQAYLLSKNQFVIVCVGSFKNEGTAQLSLKQLKRIYGDCLIRKL
ncbi:MAG: SPOR domain-containing protein [Candidatus Omnitrophota bacterium]